MNKKKKWERVLRTRDEAIGHFKEEYPFPNDLGEFVFSGDKSSEENNFLCSSFLSFGPSYFNVFDTPFGRYIGRNFGLPYLSEKIISILSDEEGSNARKSYLGLPEDLRELIKQAISSKDSRPYFYGILMKSSRLSGIIEKLGYDSPEGFVSASSFLQNLNEYWKERVVLYNNLEQILLMKNKKRSEIGETFLKIPFGATIYYPCILSKEDQPSTEADSFFNPHRRFVLGHYLPNTKEFTQKDFKKLSKFFDPRLGRMLKSLGLDPPEFSKEMNKKGSPSSPSSEKEGFGINYIGQENMGFGVNFYSKDIEE